MNTSTLHYIYDPLCGWCYGAAPLVKAAREIVTVRAHAGGMMTGSRRQAVTPQLREFVMQHDQRVAQLTGQPFGEAYVNGLLRDPQAVFDSEPPIAAMLAAEQLGGRCLDMIARLQDAHYVEGRRIADRAVLIEVAQTIGLDRDEFAAALDRQTGNGVQAHIRATRQFMEQIGAHGFPTFALEENGTIRIVDIASYMGQPQNLQAWLRDNTTLPEASAATGPIGCDADRCAV
ncbi:MAG: DsbA family protein [Luteolibacter sp.]